MTLFPNAEVGIYARLVTPATRAMPNSAEIYHGGSINGQKPRDFRQRTRIIDNLLGLSVVLLSTKKGPIAASGRNQMAEEFLCQMQRSHGERSKTGEKAVFVVI